MANVPSRRREVYHGPMSGFNHILPLSHSLVMGQPPSQAFANSTGPMRSGQRLRRGERIFAKC